MVAYICAMRSNAIALSLLAGTLGLTSPRIAAAQVLEIGDAGAVILHDRPEVTLATGATPIVEARPAIRSKPSAAPVSDAMQQAADDVQLSPELVEAVGWRESHLQQGVVSRAGAVGEMQLMPGTARALGVDPFDTRQNFGGGAAYLKALLRHYDGDVVLALAAYNAGPGAVDRNGGVPPFKETRDYVAAILERLSERAAAATER